VRNFNIHIIKTAARMRIDRFTIAIAMKMRFFVMADGKRIVTL
jgi:hypothetical protein